MSGDARAAIADRIAAFRTTGNAGVLLDDGALADVAVVRAGLGWPASGPAPAAADLRRGLDAAVTAGTFLWLRAQVLPPADRLDDLLEAAELLTAARQVAPRAVPRQVARSFTPVTGRARNLDPARVHDQAIDVLAASDGQLPAIDHAIMLLAAAARSAAGDRDHPYYLSDLGTAWLDRFAITGRARDLDHSVSAHERALAAPVDIPEDQAGLLANYSAALLAQFEHGRGREHLDHALVTARMATDLARSAARPPPAAAAPPAATTIPGPGGERAAAVRLAHLASLSRLRSALLVSYDQGGGEVDLDEAVQVAREAASLAPAGDPAHARCQASLDHLRTLQAARRDGSGAAASAADAALPPAPSPPGQVWRRMPAAG
jgi:hypothetical protein